VALHHAKSSCPPTMPGPCNNKKKRKPTNKSQKVRKPPKSETKAETCDSEPKLEDSSPSCSRTPSQHLLTPPPISYCPVDKHRHPKDWVDLSTFDDVGPTCLEDDFLPPIPYIFDPGNGPRVRDTHAFISSRYFAQKPAMHVRRRIHQDRRPSNPFPDPSMCRVCST
jgi:hypothetical protein